MDGLFGRISNFIKGLSQSNVQLNKDEQHDNQNHPRKTTLFYDEQKVILNQFRHIKTPEVILEYRSGYLQKKRNPDYIHVTFTHDKFYEDSLKYKEKAGAPCEAVDLKSYYTTFTHLEERQLQYYFHWRNSFLNGTILDASLSYRFLFAYELLNYSFNSNAAFNISALVRLLNAYKEKEEYSFLRYLNSWISDMLLEVEEKQLANQYFDPTEQRYEDRLYQKFKKNEAALVTLTYSDWKPYMDIRKPTGFYEKHKLKVNKTFRESIPVLQDMLTTQAESLEDRWFDKRKQERRRYLYQGAVLGRSSNRESYSYVIDAVYVKGQLREDITQLHRLAENIMREILGEKRMIKVTEEQFPIGLKEELLRLKVREEEAKTNKKKKITSRFVTVKGEEGKSEGGTIPKPPTEKIPPTGPPIFLEFNDEKIRMLSKENDELQQLFQQFEEETENKLNKGTIELPAEPEKLEAESEKDRRFHMSAGFSVLGNETEEDGQGFIDKLKENQKQFLQLFKNGELNQKSGNDFIKSQKSMPSVFLDTLNETAEETLGDILIEQDGDIYVVNEDLMYILKQI